MYKRDNKNNFYGPESSSVVLKNAYNALRVGGRRGGQGGGGGSHPNLPTA